MCKTLLVIVPARGRRCERLLESFTATKTLESTEIMVVTDGDDTGTWEGMDWGAAAHACLDPREHVTGKLNKTATAMAGMYDVVMRAADDCVFSTPGWDEVMLAALEDMGGSGWVYPDDKRGGVPETWMCSSDVVRELGWFTPPQMQVYYGGNAVAELGKRTGLIRFRPEAVIEHQPHPGAEDDAAELAASDLAAYQQWRTSVLPHQVAQLRRRFNKDVAWLLEKV